MTDDENTGSPGVWQEFRAQRDILVEMRTLLKEVIRAKDDHEARIRKLEERKFPLPTVAVLISTLSLIATVILYVTK